MKKRQFKKNNRLQIALEDNFKAASALTISTHNVYWSMAIVAFRFRIFHLGMVRALPPMRAIVKFSVSTFCSYCGKKIGGDGTEISHGICLDCVSNKRYL